MGRTQRTYAFRGSELEDDPEVNHRPQSLEALEAHLEMAVLLGDPGSGKTEWLKYQARRCAREMRAALERRAVPMARLCLLVYVRLPALAAVVTKD